MNDTLTNEISIQLKKIGAVHIRPNEPFTYASGIISPVYTDLRKTIGEPKLRSQIADGLAALIKTNFPDAEVIAGVATAGVPHAAWVAERLELPMIYVRSKPKDHGTGQQIEGELNTHHKVVLIDDLISTGGSVLAAATAVQKAQAEVLGVVSIFSYGLPDATENFAKRQIPLKPLLTFSQMIGELRATGLLTQADAQLADSWHDDPWHWNK